MADILPVSSIAQDAGPGATSLSLTVPGGGVSGTTEFLIYMLGGTGMIPAVPTDFVELSRGDLGVIAYRPLGFNPASVTQNGLDTSHSYTALLFRLQLNVGGITLTPGDDDVAEGVGIATATTPVIVPVQWKVLSLGLHAVAPYLGNANTPATDWNDLQFGGNALGGWGEVISPNNAGGVYTEFDQILEPPRDVTSLTALIYEQPLATGGWIVGSVGF